MNQYGHFDDKQKEYVITRPDTPLPWINYLGSNDYYGLISNTGGGYTFYRDARLRRLTRYRYNNIPFDSNGRYLYIKDGDTVWNPTWKPCKTDLDNYECRHGMGYTKIKAEKNGLEAEITFFIPSDFHVEVMDLKIRNKSSDKKSIRLWSYLEWCLWDAMDDFTNFQRNFSIGQVEVENNTIFHKTEYRERRDHFAFYSCSQETSGFDTSRDAFVGLHNGLHEPKVVKNGISNNSIVHGWAPVAVHQVDVDINPGEEKRMHFLLGYVENDKDKKWEKLHVINKEKYYDIYNHFNKPGAVDESLAALNSVWDGLLSTYQVECADPHVSRMVNVWNQYQCMTTFNMSRSASFFESGIGRGMGYRDSNQDVLGFVHIIPDRARERILDIAATQLSDGTCYHQYQPLTKKGNSAMGSGFNDDPLWLIFSTSYYIKETGDFSILDAKIGYADKDTKDATLMDHLVTSMEYTKNHRGPHQLPLIGHADWNDCLNLNCFSSEPGESFQLAGDDEGGVAESVMIAGLFCAASIEFEGILKALGQDDKAAAVAKDGDDMRNIILEHGWDGEWFLRAYDHYSKKVGSKECEEGQIFIESQGWCVLGAIGLEDGKAEKALNSLADRLATKNGVILQQPAYSTYHLELGEITSYPPGYKENAGIFTHNNTWIQIAETMIGRGDKAMEYYLSICPSKKEEQIETYRSEPYCYSQMTAGPDADRFGEAKNSWLTGTASWSFVAISQYILGVRPGFDGLVVDPCIPADWKDYAVTRSFRGKTYTIKIENPNSVSKGVKSMTVNGAAVDGNVIPLDVAGDSVDVVVTMG